ncbi:hypothetical protein H6503_03385 [Candidatus Woesearchaeota archaeon]|nr:hypothetical protein [Candidatus Woesearchaeota archaeon]
MKKQISLYLIIAGIVVFLFRYIPIYHYVSEKKNAWVSLAWGSKFCNTLTGMLFVEDCSWFRSLGYLVFIVAAVLIIAGLVLRFKKGE